VCKWLVRSVLCLFVPPLGVGLVPGCSLALKMTRLMSSFADSSPSSPPTCYYVLAMPPLLTLLLSCPLKLPLIIKNQPSSGITIKKLLNSILLNVQPGFVQSLEILTSSQAPLLISNPAIPSSIPLINVVSPSLLFDPPPPQILISSLTPSLLPLNSITALMHLIIFKKINLTFNYLNKPN